MPYWLSRTQHKARMQELVAEWHSAELETIRTNLSPVWGMFNLSVPLKKPISWSDKRSEQGRRVLSKGLFTSGKLSQLSIAIAGGIRHKGAIN